MTDTNGAEQPFGSQPLGDWLDAELAAVPPDTPYDRDAQVARWKAGELLRHAYLVHDEVLVESALAQIRAVPADN